MLKMIATLCFCLAFFSQNSVFAAACYETTIRKPSPFMGNSDEIFVLGDGTIWQVAIGEYNYLYEYYPQVIFCPNRGVLVVGGKTINIQPVN